MKDLDLKKMNKRSDKLSKPTILDRIQLLVLKFNLWRYFGKMNRTSKKFAKQIAKLQPVSFE